MVFQKYLNNGTIQLHLLIILFINFWGSCKSHLSWLYLWSGCHWVCTHSRSSSLKILKTMPLPSCQSCPRTTLLEVATQLADYSSWDPALLLNQTWLFVCCSGQPAGSQIEFWFNTLWNSAWDCASLTVGIEVPSTTKCQMAGIDYLCLCLFRLVCLASWLIRSGSTRPRSSCRQAPCSLAHLSRSTLGSEGPTVAGWPVKHSLGQSGSSRSMAARGRSRSWMCPTGLKSEIFLKSFFLLKPYFSAVCCNFT